MMGAVAVTDGVEMLAGRHMVVCGRLAVVADDKVVVTDMVKVGLPPNTGGYTELPLEDNGTQSVGGIMV